MGEDRSDEIRLAVVTARHLGWSARLEHAELMLAASDRNAPLARAVIGDVLREMRPKPTVFVADVEGAADSGREAQVDD